MAESKKEGIIEIRDIVAILRRRKWLIVIPFILVTAIAFGGSYLLQERYQSSTMVVIDETMFLSRELMEFVPGQETRGFAATQQRQNRLISIRNEIVSTQYLTRLIDELTLFQNPAVQLQAQKLNAQQPDMDVQDLIYRILIERLRRNITVAFNGQNIIEISAESHSPTEAKNIASKLAEIFKDEQLKHELSGVRGALDFSDEQLSIYRKNLEDAEERLTDYQSEYLQNQLDESVTADTNIRTIMADLDNLRVLLDDNIREQTRLRGELSQYSKSQLKLDLGRDYERTKEEIFEETHRLATFMPKYTWSDPKVMNSNLSINRKLRELRTMVSDGVADQFGDATAEDRQNMIRFFSLQAEEMVLQQKKNEFDVSLTTLRNRIAREPEFEIQQQRLENAVTSARSIYETFQDQLTGSEISQSLMRGGAESKYRVMEPASLPLTPVKPNRIRLAMLGMVMGLVIGGVAVLLAELFDNSFKKVEDVEEILNAPVLATIPNIDSIKGKIKVS